jgi:hypothetical protein
MIMQRTLRARVVGSVSALALVAGLTASLTGGAGAAPNPQPSDSRATMVSGNVTTCAGAGFDGDIQVGSSSNSNASDANVQGVVKPNAGTTQPGTGEEVDITLLNPSAVIDAVIVKGGPAYNVYSNSSVLPPALGPDQHYISPLNPGGNVPTISHWFVCYSVEQPDQGALQVTKVVAAPDGTPLTPLPTSYTATVTCTPPPLDEIQAAAPLVSTVTFGAGGGIGTAVPPLENLDVGTVCVVVENGTDAFDPATKVIYTPEGANTEGVVIPDSDVGVTVQIENDFSGVPVEVSPADVVHPPVAAPIAVAPAFTG